MSIDIDIKSGISLIELEFN